MRNDLERTLRRRGLLLSSMVLPLMSNNWFAKINAAHDRRSVAVLAHKVFDYKRKYGVFPESIELVSNDLRDVINNRPFVLDTDAVKFDKEEQEIKGIEISAQYGMKGNEYYGRISSSVFIPVVY